MVDFLFVNQPRFKGLPVPREVDCSSPQKDNFMSPTGLLFLAGVIRDLGYSLKVVDANLLDLNYQQIGKIIRKENPLCVIGSMTAPTIYHDNKLAKVSKQNSSAFYGTWGPIPSALRNFMFKRFPDLDFILENEPEMTLKELAVNIMKTRKNPFKGVKGLSYRKGKKVIFNGWRELLTNLDSLPIPYYEGVPIKKYYTPFVRRRPAVTMRTSRGCPASCIFCITGGQDNIYRGYGKPWRAYSPQRTLKEIKFLVDLGVKEINFFDPEFTVNPKRVQEICKGIVKEKLDIIWNCTARVDFVDEKSLKWMKKAGCYGIAYGMESANREILKICKKNITPEQVERAIRLTLRAGIQPSLFFMIGLPGERKETIRETFDFAKKMMLKYRIRPQCTIATPYPGTVFYEMAKQNNWIKEDFSNLDQTMASISYPHLSKKELQMYHKMFYTKIVLHPKRLMTRLAKIRNPTEIKNIFVHLKEAFSAVITNAQYIR